MKNKKRKRLIGIVKRVSAKPIAIKKGLKKFSAVEVPIIDAKKL